MAHSIQSVGQRTAILNDFDLIALICLMDAELQDPGDRFFAIRSTVREWSASLRGYGPGTIRLGLDALVSANNTAGELESLFAALEKRIHHFSGRIPAPFLNSRCSAPGITFSDYDGNLLLTALQKLRALAQSRGT